MQSVTKNNNVIKSFDKILFCGAPAKAIARTLSEQGFVLAFDVTFDCEGIFDGNFGIMHSTECKGLNTSAISSKDIAMLKEFYCHMQ